MFFEERRLKKDNRILLIIDDTYNEKKGKHSSESIVDLMVYVIYGFNLPIPDEGGLLYKLKAIGLIDGK